MFIFISHCLSCLSVRLRLSSQQSNKVQLIFIYIQKTSASRLHHQYLGWAPPPPPPPPRVSLQSRDKVRTFLLLPLHLNSFVEMWAANIIDIQNHWAGMVNNIIGFVDAADWRSLLALLTSHHALGSGSITQTETEQRSPLEPPACCLPPVPPLVTMYLHLIEKKIKCFALSTAEQTRSNNHWLRGLDLLVRFLF